jgi:thiol-disulfide isomerase/thioredoxin
MQSIRLGLAVIALAAFSYLPANAATPTVGQPAPALTFTNLLQAPAGTKTDWPSLRGKVVVLEFWATWCGGCVQEIPHLNSLIQSVDPNKVQFIAVDDEDPALVKKILTKLPINGWLGIDTSEKIIDTYDAKVRPRTIVVDTQGRIAGILRPTQLNKEQLLALADGKPVTFPVDSTADIRQQAFKEANAAANAATAGTGVSKPLFDISIRPGDPAGRTAFAHRPSKEDDSYTFDALNASLSTLLQYPGGIASDRLIVHGDKGARYSLHISAPGKDIDQLLAPAIQLAIVTATKMKMSHVITMEDAYVLEVTPKTASLLPPSTSEQSMCFYNSKAGKLVMMQSTLDSLVQTLETVLGKPVLNESGVAGKFDANFDLPTGNAEAAKTALEKNLGLTLVKAKRSIDRIVLDPLPSTEKDTSKTTNKPAAASEKPAPAAVAPTQKP